MTNKETKKIINTIFNSEDLTSKSHCTKCGNCCSNRVPLIQVDIDRIKTYINKHSVKEVTRGVPFAGEIHDGMCPFLSLDSKCNIYPVRPKACRLYQCNKKYYDMVKHWKGSKPKEYDMRKTFFREVEE